MARSPNYPGISLREAVDLVEQLYDKYDRREMTELEAVEAWEYSSLHGASRRKVAALKYYGLLEDRENGVAVSDRALAILRPEDEQERVRALREALHRPTIFHEVLENYGDSLSSGRLKSVLIRDLDFVNSAAEKFDNVYRDSVDYVREEKTALGLLTGSDVDEDDSDGDDTDDNGDSQPPDRRKKPKEGVMEFKMNLSKNAVAHLTVEGDVGDADMWLLRNFLMTSQMAVLNAFAEQLEEDDARQLREKLINDLREEG